MTDDPVEKTTEFLKDWTRVLQSDELLVVYYVSHGHRSSRRPTPRPFGVARRGGSRSDDANIDWPVVMLLNCCYGANAWVSRNLEEDGFKSLPGKVMVCLTAYDPC